MGLAPSEADGGHLRTLTQSQAAGLCQARSYAEFVVKWMAGRANSRVRNNLVPSHSRHIRAFWDQLTLAREVVDDVRKQHPDYNLWESGDVLLARALEHRAGIDGAGQSLSRKNCRRCPRLTARLW